MSEVYMINEVPREPVKIEDKSVSGVCPHCSCNSQFTLVGHVNSSILNSKGAGIYVCFSCHQYVFIEWDYYNQGYDDGYYNPIIINESIPTFDTKYIPESVNDPFLEALVCFGKGCYNAFAAMCRRTIQAIFQDKGVEGTTRIHNQLFQFIDLNNDSELQDILNELIKTGHDGSHPHLPEVTNERAILMLALMEDIFEQIYKRPGRITEAKKLRDKVIEKKRNT